MNDTAVLEILKQAAQAQRAGKLEEAEALYRQALVLKPDYAPAQFGLGTMLSGQGRLEEAVTCLQNLLKDKPDVAEVHLALGNVYDRLSRLNEARTHLEKAVALKPDFASAHCNLGSVLGKQDKVDEAIAHFRTAVTLQPDYAEAWYQLGYACSLRVELDNAIACYREAIALRPDYAEAHNGLGYALYKQGNLDEAIQEYGKAIALKPDYSLPWNNLGLVQRDLGRAEEAATNFIRAVELKPDFIEALNNLGVIQRDLQHFDQAMGYFNRAQMLAPANAGAHWNEGVCRLTLGDLRAGFEQAEWRWKQAEFAPMRAVFPEPPWLGQEDLRGKTILLWSEQGLGDVLQFCRYVPRVAARGATVVLGIPSELTRLLARLPGAARVIGTGAARPGYDYHCPLMSLPLAFGTTLETIPAAVPYLQADTAQIAAWRDRLGPARGRRIGLVWSGNPAHKNDRNRSIALAEFAPVLGMEAEFISMQKEVRESDRATLAAHAGLRHYGEWLKDMDDTAALLSCLDLVITVDTAVAHLAGALGKPVWILLPYTPDWRWLLDRSDSPWYPTARLFRQPAIGDWTDPIKRIVAELRQ